jgi:signal transduction histidine kinase
MSSTGDFYVPKPAAGTSHRRMHARTRSALWLTLAFWGSCYILLTLGTALSGNEHLADVAAVRILTTLLGLFLCYLMHLLLKHPSLNTAKRRLIALAITAPIAAEIFAWAVYFAEAAVDPAVGNSQFTWTAAVRVIAFWTWFFLAWAGLYLALNYSFDVQEEQQRSVELSEQAHVAQLRALHSQINPHFLFNSLNSVSALILDRSLEKAEEMVIKLAHFLRLGLAADPTRKLSLDLELELQRSYLEIEQLRYSDLSVSIDLPGPLENALVPALILQPVVENAVKYGVSGAPPPATISISARVDGGWLILEVVDSGKGRSQDQKSGGIGLSNVRQRLELIYGEGSARLSAGREANGCFKAEISLPLEMS